MEDTSKISKRLEKMLKNKEIKADDAIKYLTYLKDLDMDLDILTKTGIGLIINKMRKETTDSTVSFLAKSLIKQWKKLVPENPDSNGNGHQDSPSQEGKGGSDEGDDGPPGKRRKSDDGSSDEQKCSTFLSKNDDTMDSVRLKCREMLQQALEFENVPTGAFDTSYLARQIENSVFSEFQKTDMKYKNRIRSRVLNLKDVKNANLRHNVLMGHLKPEKFATLTAEEMASDEMKVLREKYTKEAIDDHQMATSGGTETHLLRCSKCRKTKCTYNQVQTRSADEPMTTFVYCNECGHRWKFC